MDALGGCRLEVVGGYLGAGGTVIVWPHGTKAVTENPLTIEIPDNGIFTLGEEVRVGGGYVLEHSPGESAADPFDVAGVTVPSSCSYHDVFLARQAQLSHGTGSRKAAICTRRRLRAIVARAAHGLRVRRGRARHTGDARPLPSAPP